MYEILEFDPFEFLVSVKFPRLWVLPPSFLNEPKRRSSQAEVDKREAERKAYRSQLEALPSDEIEALVQAERAKQHQEAIEKARKEEQARFFHLPHASADFDHWSKAAHWTLEEAVALALGKAPEAVNWSSVKTLVKRVAFRAPLF